MVVESKEWIKTCYRSKKTKSGGVFVYIDSDTLRFSGLPTDKELIARRYPTRNKKVIIQFKVKE